MSQEQNACTVSEAMNVAKRSLEQISLTVVGEVSEFNDRSNYKAAYFTIRDNASSMSCIMWHDAYRASGIALRQGMLVQVTGKLSCYPARGQMQFNVRTLQKAGEGFLRMQVALLAQKLQNEGLMDETRKQRVPALPQRIALITSPSGKAVHDVLRTLRRRYPLGKIMFYGVTVEGDPAPQIMSQALHAACSADPAPDVILLVRGGGTYEALMPFNDEGLARSIASCHIPVVTGIGHEPDNSIADMVADVRCSTPTAAAEAIAPSIEELSAKLVNAQNILKTAYFQRLDAFSYRLNRLADRSIFNDPYYLLGGYIQMLEFLEERLRRAIPNSLSSDGQYLQQLEQRLKNAIPNALNADKQRLEMLYERIKRTIPSALSRYDEQVNFAQETLCRLIQNKVHDACNNFALTAAKLDALSPIKTLSRGYSIAYLDDKTVLDSVNNVSKDDEISLRLKDGRLNCNVISVERQDS